MTIRHPLRLFLDCSTAHLSPVARAWLEARAEAHDEMIAATPYGWFAWCGDDASDDLPADLSAVMDYARGLEADYILFDADAACIPALPTFAWD